MLFHLLQFDAHHSKIYVLDHLVLDHTLHVLKLLLKINKCLVLFFYDIAQVCNILSDFLNVSGKQISVLTFNCSLCSLFVLIISSQLDRSCSSATFIPSKTSEYLYGVSKNQSQLTQRKTSILFCIVSTKYSQSSKFPVFLRNFFFSSIFNQVFFFENITFRRFRIISKKFKVCSSA